MLHTFSHWEPVEGRVGSLTPLLGLGRGPGLLRAAAAAADGEPLGLHLRGHGGEQLVPGPRLVRLLQRLLGHQVPGQQPQVNLRRIIQTCKRCLRILRLMNNEMIK